MSVSQSNGIVKANEDEEKWSHWTRLPNIVLEKTQDPYELALLFVIKKVAGDEEEGVCYMTLRNLANLSKMGFNTVRRKIHSLAEKGLIQTEIKKNRKGRYVYHIRIPGSLWEENERRYPRKVKGLAKATVPEKIGVCTREDRGVCTREYDMTKNQILTKNQIEEPQHSGDGLHDLATYLLVEEGVSPGKAEQLASRHGFLSVLAAAWALLHAEDVRSPGGFLVSWLRSNDGKIAFPAFPRVTTYPYGSPIPLFVGWVKTDLETGNNGLSESTVTKMVNWRAKDKAYRKAEAQYQAMVREGEDLPDEEREELIKKAKVLRREALISIEIG